jgi:hypothetical protein
LSDIFLKLPKVSYRYRKLSKFNRILHQKVVVAALPEGVQRLQLCQRAQTRFGLELDIAVDNHDRSVEAIALKAECVGIDQVYMHVCNA